MKTLKFSILFLFSVLLFSSCGSESKSDWSQADQDKWMKSCQENLVNKVVKEEDKDQLEDLCKCMLKVTSSEYTAEEAANLSEDQERKLLENCDYSW
jgi:hypothetical protein